MLFKDGQHYSSLGFKVTQEEAEKLNQRLENLANQSKPKILICTSSPEGVSEYMRQKFINWEIVEMNTNHMEMLGESFDTIWIDELVKYCPLIHDIPIDKPNKQSKLPKQKQTIPFWANNYRRK